VFYLCFTCVSPAFYLCFTISSRISTTRNCDYLFGHVRCTGLDRSAFDNKSVSFEDHCHREHNMWNYLYFIVLVKVKDPTEFTGPESYVYTMIKVAIASEISVYY
jgi:hypothetical protein